MPRWTLELDLFDLPPMPSPTDSGDERELPDASDAVALMGQAYGWSRLDDEIPEYGQVWLWDRYFAHSLFAMGEGSIEAQALKEALELWSVNLSAKLFQPREHLMRKGHLTVCEALQWRDDGSDAGQAHAGPVQGEQAGAEKAEGKATGSDHDVPSGAPRKRLSVVLEVEGKAGELPSIIEVQAPRSARERFWTVIALAQYFIDTNDLFARELPIHVLAMRKFHADIAAPHTTTARDDSPFYAIQKALEYFQKANRGTVQ
ncbi:MAG: hypothetical protein ACK4IT_00145 [Thioalkalivibrionaceae bacterium]